MQIKIKKNNVGTYLVGMGLFFPRFTDGIFVLIESAYVKKKYIFKIYNKHR